MTTEERLVADYAGTGMTTGKQVMSYRRSELRKIGALTAVELRDAVNGVYVRFAGKIIARQRPGTAKGFTFLSLEDETDIGSVIITLKLFEQERRTVMHAKFVFVEGVLQNQDGVVHVKATKVSTLSYINLEVRSHDFH